MDAKHTPGPWRFAHFSTLGIYDEEQRAKNLENNPEYFEVSSEYDKNYNRLSVSAHMGEANARLIAAAPELLACAKRSAAVLRSAGIEPSAYSDNPLEELLHLTATAITAATGAA